MNRNKLLYLLYLAVAVLGYSHAVPAEIAILDDFEKIQGWSVATSEGVALEIAQDEGHTGMGMRLDFDFHGAGGFLIARKSFPMTLPSNYAFSFNIRGNAPVNNLEFKLVDPSGVNIWWRNFRNFEFPGQWKKITIKKRHIDFAWGPAGDGEIKQVAAVEFAISAGTGGKGSVWIDDLHLEPRPTLTDYTLSPIVRASTTASGHEPSAVFDQEPATDWQSGSIAEGQWFLIDFQQIREYGGFIIDWDPEDYAQAYEIQVSDDAKTWQRVYSVDSSNGGRDYVALPDIESRYLRLDLQRSSRGHGYRIHAIEIKPYQFSSSPNNLFEAIANDSLKGAYPRYFSGEQSFWTIIGVAGDTKEAMINEEGLLEVDKASFSIDPFIYVDGRLITWAETHRSQELEQDYLPIPSVTWKHAGIRLKITALASGQPGASFLYAKYRLENTTNKPQQGSLYLALRPFQVNPPWQSLNMVGGVGNIQEVHYDGTTVRINRKKAVTSLTAADHFGVAKFAQGSITDYLFKGSLPPQTSVFDPFGYASGALEYGFDLPPAGVKEVYLVIPFYGTHSPIKAALPQDEARRVWEENMTETQRYWQAILNRVQIQLPSSGKKIADTLKSTLAYILINQDGPAIQPGSRTYERSWIRDGALTSSALLSMGHTQEVRNFIQWYAKFQFANGKVPCCVDSRGADPVAENDSHGEFIYLIMEYYRYTHDVGFLTRMWPYVIKAVEYIESLRSQRMTDEYKTPERVMMYGLVPESISHEGYASNPVHSYWDDFFILRGLKDATDMSQILGEDKRHLEYAQLREDFQNDLYASISRSITAHGIDYIPGSAELGDFDATATTIALAPGGEMNNLPEPELTRTFDRYYEYFNKRRDGNIEWKAYTPYELRTVGSFIQMGRKNQAHEALDFFLQSQRPAAWNSWGEIVWRVPRAPKYIGDLPHTWVGSDYIRSLRTFFVFEREADKSLVIAAGLRSDWVTSENGVTVKRFPTYYGTLNYTVRKRDDNDIWLRMSGDITMPPGKIVVESPLSTPLKAVTVNGTSIESFDADEALIDQFPANVILHY
jgi:hypothetical protein